MATLRGFSIVTKKGTQKNFYFTKHIKDFVPFDELKKLAYELTPILRRG